MGSAMINEIIEEAAIRLCRYLDLDMLDLSEEHGFTGDYNLNWARHEITKALAVQRAISETFK